MHRVYDFLVNRHAGIRSRYHQFHDHATGTKRIFSWFYLFILNFCYYVLFCKFLDQEPLEQVPKGKPLPTTCSESQLWSKTQHGVDYYIDACKDAELVSFDIFDTLIVRPFEHPTDLFHLIGLELGIMNFKELRIEAEQRARKHKKERGEGIEVSLEEIWEELSKRTGQDSLEGQRIEIALEEKFCKAHPLMKQVYEQLQREGKRIIITSDMYLPKEVLVYILKKNGYTGFEKLYVSNDYRTGKSDGGLYERIQEEIGAGVQVIHLGDNVVSDIKRAKEHGWKALHVPGVYEKIKDYRAFELSPIIGSVYRGLVSNHLYSGAYVHSMEFEYGYVYGGLFAVGFCSFIHNYAQQHEMDKILFFSRDGDILKKVYDKMYPMDVTEYVYCSRRVVTVLLADENRYDFFRRFVHQRLGDDCTVAQVFETMHLQGLLPPFLEQYSYEDAGEERFGRTQEADITSFLKKNWTQVMQMYEPLQNYAKEYYTKIAKDCKKVCAVDIGWGGSQSLALDLLFRKRWGQSCRVTGILAGTNTIHATEPQAAEIFLQSQNLVSYMFSQAKNRELMKQHDPAKGYNVFWELLVSSPTPQCIGFSADGPVFAKPDQNVEGSRQVQEGILCFAQEYIECFSDLPYLFEISGADSYGPMLRALHKKEKYLKEIEKRFSLEKGVG